MKIFATKGSPRFTTKSTFKKYKVSVNKKIVNSPTVKKDLNSTINKLRHPMQQNEAIVCHEPIE